MTSVPQTWLSRHVTVPEAELCNLVNEVPFGEENKEWEALKKLLRPNDELWEFSSPPELWIRNMGKEGFAVVREGSIVDCFELSQ